MNKDLLVYNIFIMRNNHNKYNSKLFKKLNNNNKYNDEQITRKRNTVF